jgi:hypothetical protein
VSSSCNVMTLQTYQVVFFNVPPSSMYREFLFPSPGKVLEIRQVDGQYETFSLVEKTVKQRLAQFILDSPRIATTSESLLAGSMAMALCYIARVRMKINKDQ